MCYVFSLVFTFETDIKSVLALETNLPHIDHITSKNIENNTGATKNLFQKIHLPQW